MTNFTCGARNPTSTVDALKHFQESLMHFKTPAAALLFVLANAAGAAPFSVSANGQEVTDSATGLIWRRCAEGMAAKGGSCSGTPLAIDHAGALKRAEAQAKATGAAWRLPSSQELQSIADESKFKLAIDTTAFPGTPAEHFWTRDPYITDYFYAVNFYNGFRYDRYHTSPHHVRLVRGGQ